MTPRFVAVWVATSEPANLRLSIFEGLTPVGPGTGVVTGPSPRNVSSDQPMVGVGSGLHVGVVALALPVAEQLLPGQVYSYNVTFIGVSTHDLRSRGLLAEGTLDGKPHLPIGYEPNTLPSFAVPPAILDDVRLYQVSCRKPHGQDPDALAFLDEQIAAERVDPAHRPHQLFLTGDQIYADDVPIPLLPHLTAAGRTLIGRDEVLPLGATAEVAVTQENLPAGFRQWFTRNAAGFTSGDADSHLFSLGEYCAAYLFNWSNVLWPPMEPRENGIPASLAAFDHEIDVTRLSVEGLRELQIALFQNPDGGEVPSQRRVEFFYGLTDAQRDLLFTEYDEDFLDFARVRDPSRDPPAGFDFLIDEARFLISGEPEAEARRQLREFRRYTEAFIGLFKNKSQSSIGQARRTVTCFDALAKVRRALANVATYMIMDDHEVTDDWYVNRAWRARVHASTTGRAVLRNGLVAYGLFQGWGNDPARFLAGFTGTADADGSAIELEDSTTDFSSRISVDLGKEIRNRTDGSAATIRAVAGDTLTTSPLTGGADDTWASGDEYEIADGTNLPLLTHAPQLYASSDSPDPAAAAALDALFGLDESRPTARWDYEVPGTLYHVRVLDTRTRRELIGLRDAPNLLAPEALDQQLPPGPLAAGLELLVVVSPAPILGPPSIEELFQPLVIRKADIEAAHAQEDLEGSTDFDLEGWSANPTAFEALLSRLASYGKVVVLAGDVHYGTGAELSYWRGAAATPARIAQFTSSAAKNIFRKMLIFLFGSTFGRRALRIGAPLERLAWADASTDPVELSSEPTPPSLRARLNRSPVLIPTHGWPEGTALSVPAEWRWRLRLLYDGRADAERPEPVQPSPLGGPVTASEAFASYRRVARRHVDFLDDAIFGRRFVFSTNVGRVSFDSTSGAIVARHDLFAVHPEDTLARTAPYTRHEVSLAPGAEAPPTI